MHLLCTLCAIVCLCAREREREREVLVRSISVHEFIMRLYRFSRRPWENIPRNLTGYSLILGKILPSLTTSFFLKDFTLKIVCSENLKLFFYIIISTRYLFYLFIFYTIIATIFCCSIFFFLSSKFIDISRSHTFFNYLSKK